MSAERKYQGIGVSPGIAVSRAAAYRPEALEPPRREVQPGECETEWERFQSARDITRRQLRDMVDVLGLEAAGGEAGIIDAHLMVLDDEVLEGEVHAEIFDRRHNAEWAVRDVAAGYIAKLKAFDDELLGERASDIADIARRLIRALMGTRGEPVFKMTEPCIVVADDLTPSETLALPRGLVAGVVLARGGITSHAALLVRAIGIPAVFGIGDGAGEIADGETVAIDGNSGIVIANPGEAETGSFLGRAAERGALAAEINARAGQPAVTPDGFEVTFLANIEDERGIGAIAESGGSGVGLFRTEYLWLAEGRPVDEDAQTEIYARVARGLGDKPLTIRLFDLGGDKFDTGAGGRESNPFLGLRSIRYLLKNERVCKIQLRAILRAGAATGKAISILVPMVSDLREIVRTRKLMEECTNELREEGVECIPPSLGIMVEVPSAAICSPILARHADFFSIGTNDLTQYTLAVDRCNEAAAYLYQPLHPAVLNLISMAAEAAHHAHIPLAVCGEMAGDPIHAAILLGLRVDTLSMAPAAIPLVKEMVRRIPFAEAQAAAASALDSATSAQVRHLSRDLLARFAPEILRQC